MINYTKIVLLVLGLFGVLMHNLVQLNKINRASDGNINLAKYFKLEIFSILISICVVIASVFISQEIKQLEAAGKWLGLAFIAIGYMGQSLLIFVMEKLNDKVRKSSNE